MTQPLQTWRGLINPWVPRTRGLLVPNQYPKRPINGISTSPLRPFLFRIRDLILAFYPNPLILSSTHFSSPYLHLSPPPPLSSSWISPSDHAFTLSLLLIFTNNTSIRAPARFPLFCCFFFFFSFFVRIYWALQSLSRLALWFCGQFLGSESLLGFWGLSGCCWICDRRDLVGFFLFPFYFFRSLW